MENEKFTPTTRGREQVVPIKEKFLILNQRMRQGALQLRLEADTYGSPGGIESGQGRSSESRWRKEAGNAEKLQSFLIWKEMNARPADQLLVSGALL